VECDEGMCNIEIGSCFQSYRESFISFAVLTGELSNMVVFFEVKMLKTELYQFHYV